jgi:hypothetical protein
MTSGAALNEVNTHWSDNQAIVMLFASFRKAEQSFLYSINFILLLSIKILFL